MIYKANFQYIYLFTETYMPVFFGIYFEFSVVVLRFTFPRFLKTRCCGYDLFTNRLHRPGAEARFHQKKKCDESISRL